MQRVYSTASEKHPTRNEDASFALDNGALGVFDGLGGQPGSEYASALAAQHIATMLETQPVFELSPSIAEQFFTEILEDTNDCIRREQLLGRRGIATTAIIAQVFRDPSSDGRYVQFAHCGDSRGYLYREGKFLHTTLDHAGSTTHLSVDEQRRIQRHFAQVSRRDHVDPYDWFHLGMRNIVASCLNGKSNIDISTYAAAVQPGDLILLTSDGVHDNLTTREIRAQIGSYGIDAPRQLVLAAQRRSREPRHGTIVDDGTLIDVDYIRPKPDDMTAAVRLVE